MGIAELLGLAATQLRLDPGRLLAAYQRLETRLGEAQRAHILRVRNEKATQIMRAGLVPKLLMGYYPHSDLEAAGLFLYTPIVEGIHR